MDTVNWTGCCDAAAMMTPAEKRAILVKLRWMANKQSQRYSQ
jgi:hypothetical protein